MKYTIVILEEGNRPNPHCPAHEMFVIWTAMKHRHLTIAICERDDDRNRQGLTEEEARKGAETEFQAYEKPLEIVTSFK